MSQQKEEETIWCQKQINAAKFFKENLLMIEIKKRVYLGLSKLVLSKILMYEFWYDYVKPKYGEKTKLQA